MAKIVKVLNNGSACIFKSAIYGAENQLEREIVTLQQMTERWGSCRDRPRILRLLGVVTSDNEVVGILEEFIDGENLFELDLTESSVEERRAWKTQIFDAFASPLHGSKMLKARGARSTVSVTDEE